MRKLIFACLILATATIPHQARAQSRDAVINAITSTICRDNFACPDGNVVLPPAALANAAAKCVSRSFGISTTETLFDLHTDLDYENCLHSSYVMTSKGMGGEAQVAASCCITPAADQNGCAFTCAVLPVGQ